MRGHQLGRGRGAVLENTPTDRGKVTTCPCPPPHPKYPLISAERAVTSDGRYVFPEQPCQGEPGWLCRGCPGGVGGPGCRLSPPIFPPEERFSLEDPEWSDIHVVTGALKLFFRELPEPLVPYELFNPFIEAISKCLPHRVPRLWDFGGGGWCLTPVSLPRAAGPPGAGAAGG